MIDKRRELNWYVDNDEKDVDNNSNDKDISASEIVAEEGNMSGKETETDNESKSKDSDSSIMLGDVTVSESFDTVGRKDDE